MGAVKLQVIPSLYKFFNTLILETHMKNLLRVKNTVLLATMTRCPSNPIADIAFY